MNASGQSVRAAIDFYKLSVDDLLVVCDDFHLPIGKLRFRARGTSGGQKGLADIIRHLETDQFSRLRIAVGPVPDGWDAANFVLGKFSPDERKVINDVVSSAADAVACWCARGIDESMNQYN
jgi:PTH1 family peptidyl-tRNA hydrolase